MFHSRLIVVLCCLVWFQDSTAQQDYTDEPVTPYFRIVGEANVAYFHVVGDVPGVEDRIDEMVRCLNNVPREHHQFLPQFFLIVPHFPGSRVNGGGWYPRASMSDWLGRKAKTGIDDDLLNRIIESDESGFVAISHSRMRPTEQEPQLIHHLSVLHESAHAIQAAGHALVPARTSAASLSQIYARSPDVDEHAAEAYSRYIASPSFVCRPGREVGGETRQECTTRVRGILRTSPAFELVDDAWRPLGSCRTNAALDNLHFMGPLAQDDQGDASKSGDSQAKQESRIVFAAHGYFFDKNGDLIREPSESEVSEYFGGPPAGTGRPSTNTKQIGPAASRETPMRSTPYGQQCEFQGVPLPPAFDSGLWQTLGRIPADQLMVLRENPLVEMIKFVPRSTDGDPTGLCLALPRAERDGTIKALGVICQGKASGKACFWDNIDKTRPPVAGPANKITAQRYQDLDVRLFQGADQLVENCTNCHRGSNAFILFPDMQMDGVAGRLRDRLPFNEKSITGATFYDPVGPAGWQNPIPDSELSQGFGTCAESACHGSRSNRLPDLTVQYCRAVLMPSVNGIDGRRDTAKMPPPGEDRSLYRDEILHAEVECANVMSTN